MLLIYMIWEDLAPRTPPRIQGTELLGPFLIDLVDVHSDVKK